MFPSSSVRLISALAVDGFSLIAKFHSLDRSESSDGCRPMKSKTLNYFSPVTSDTSIEKRFV